MKDEIEELKEINEQHKKINGELREEIAKKDQMLTNILTIVYDDVTSNIEKIQEVKKELIDYE